MCIYICARVCVYIYIYIFRALYIYINISDVKIGDKNKHISPSNNLRLWQFSEVSHFTSTWNSTWNLPVSCDFQPSGLYINIKPHGSKCWQECCTFTLQFTLPKQRLHKTSNIVVHIFILNRAYNVWTPDSKSMFERLNFLLYWLVSGKIKQSRKDW